MGSSSPSIDEPLALYASGAVSYLNADGLGSVVATNNPTGTVNHSSIFDAWGVVKGETGTRSHSFTYTGRETGEAGLHSYRARLLDPARGRFVGQDEITTQSQYSYVFSSPIGYRDSSGRWPSRTDFFGKVFSGGVHQAAIDRALDFLPPADREYLKFMQVVADMDQSEAGSFKHAMTVPKLGRKKSIDEANCWVAKLMRQAIQLEKDGHHLAALRQFAMALHTIQDATSPAHYFFEPWHDPSLKQPGAYGEAVGHILTEDFDPGADSHLDRATRWMWGIFSGEYDLPTDFFANTKVDPWRP
jgi:RHS repeat-associated protein